MREPRSVDLAFDLAKITSSVHAELELVARTRAPVVDGRYRLDHRIGEGSFGSVYQAHDLELDRKVALKTLPLDDAATSGREARALAQLTHPNVVRIYDHGFAYDYWYLVLELLEGQDLATWLHASPRSHDEIVATFLEAGKGLAAAHTAGLVHRDFKPSNVMVTNDGRVVVVDFGQARRVDTVDGVTDGRPRSGTLAYMAPERLAGEAGDTRSDQFSFCVALWESLAGQSPFTGDDVQSRFASILTGPRSRPPARGVLGRVLSRGTSKRPSDRFPTMEQLLAQFERDRRARRRRPFLAAAGLSAAALVAIGLLPEGLTTRHGNADPAEAMPTSVREQLELAEQHARSGEPGRAIDALEKAERRAKAEGEVLDVADRAMTIGDILQEQGHRAAAASAYLVANDGYSAQGLEQLARWAAEQASVAMDPAPSR